MCKVTAENNQIQAEAVKSELRNYIRQKYRVADDDPDFSDAVHLYDYGYVDSFGAVQLLAFMESTFGIKFSQSDLTMVPLNTIEQMAAFIVKQKNQEP